MPYREAGDLDLIIVYDTPKRFLDRYYIPTRYPNGLPGGTPFQVFTMEDLGEALDDVRNVFKIAGNFLSKLREEQLK